MSDQLRKSLGNASQQDKPRVWCLSQSDWKRLENHLKAAKIITDRAEAVTPEQWAEWTSEFSEEQGFPSIIYHDKPIIIRPLKVAK